MRANQALASFSGPALRLQPDSRLVALAREGQDRAFEEIVRRYREALVAYARGFDPGGAEDIVQDGLLSAYTALKDGGSEVALRPWLYTIVRNRALNALRDAHPHEPLDEQHDGVPQPPEVAERREQLAQLVQGLKELPPEQRDAIVRRELEGASHAEIAAALGTTRGAVRQLIFRARSTLRDGLGLLLPLPALRALLEAEGARIAATAAGGTVVGAAGVAGGGGAVAAKAGAALAVAALAVGSGVALHDRSGGNGARGDGSQAAGGGKGPIAGVTARDGEVAQVNAGAGVPSSGPEGGGGRGDDEGSEGSGGSASSGSGGGEDGRDVSGSSGSGSGDPDDGDEAEDGDSGPGGGESGSGEVEQEDDVPDGDSSGSSGASESSGSGDRSGSEQDGSGSSGESGSGESGSSGSGSSGSGDGSPDEEEDEEED